MRGNELNIECLFDFFKKQFIESTISSISHSKTDEFINEKEVVKNMKTYYDQLMDYKGADELKVLVRRWEVLSENIKKSSFDSSIVLPDLFVYTQPGYGNTKLFSLISEYLDSKQNLMSFYGDVKFFEFKLDYCSPNGQFTELYRLIECAQSAAGFRSLFKGIIRISIDEWVGHHKEKYFIDFLRFLDENTSNWLVILTISNQSENEKTKELESIVSMFLRIEKITLHMPSDIDFVEYATSYLEKFGVELSDEAKNVLLNSIAVLKENKYFCSYHTIEGLCNDIVYVLFSESTDVGNIITAEMLAGFSSESDYIKRTITKIKKSVSVGFLS